MGRLEDIIERNRNPRAAIRNRKGRRGVGLPGVVLFVVLLLLIFTDLAKPPEPDPPPLRQSDQVRGVMLSSPAKRAGSGRAGSGNNGSSDSSGSGGSGGSGSSGGSGVASRPADDR